MKRVVLPKVVVSRSLLAFCAAVALALGASLIQLMPDITAQSADAMSRMPDGLEQMILGEPGPSIQ